MARDRKLEERLAVLDAEVDEKVDGAVVDAGLGNEALGIVHALGAVALELRALRLAVLSREPVKWWW